MAGKGYDDSGSTDAFLIMVLIFVVMIYILFKNNFYLIAGLWKYLRVIELFMFSWIPDWVPGYGSLEIKQAMKTIWEIPSTELMPETVAEFDRHFAKWFSWIPGVILFYIGAKFIAKGDRVSMRHDMETLLAENKKVNSLMEDVVNIHPEKMDLHYKRELPETSATGFSLSPADFALMTPPLGLEGEEQKIGSGVSIWDGEDSFDIDLAERAFKAQLGKTYAGEEQFSSAERKIYNFLVLKLTFNVKEMTKLTKKIILSLVSSDSEHVLNVSKLDNAEKKLYNILSAEIAEKKKKKENLSDITDYRNIEKIVLSKKYENAYKMITGELIMKRHAFTRVGMMSLLVEARNGGVVACSEFKWLKGQDRTLWYALSSVGRKVSFVESAGCFAHWLLEIDMGMPISHGEVHEAVEGLHKALKLDIVDDFK